MGQFTTLDRLCAVKGDAANDCIAKIDGVDGILLFFLIGQMIVPGSSYWNIGIGREIGDVEKDEKG